MLKSTNLVKHIPKIKNNVTGGSTVSALLYGFCFEYTVVGIIKHFNSFVVVFNLCYESEV